MQLEGDAIGEPEVPLEQHGKRFASLLTVHERKHPPLGLHDTPGGAGRSSK